MIVETVLAPNPGIYTGPGTNTYLVTDRDEIAVIDPGPVVDRHRLAILEAIGDRTPVAVIATHTHSDHAPLANPLATRLGVPVYGNRPGPEFAPDILMNDGDDVRVGGVMIEAVHTPGHTADHLCFRLGDRLFTGDHIMGGSTVVMEDATAYLQSLYRVQDLDVRRIEPGHGPSMDDAGAAIAGYIEHRLAREREILDVIRAGGATVEDVVETVYAFVPIDLRPAATQQVIVQLNKLYADDEVWFPAGEAGPSTMVELNVR
ncbi:MAG: MBL fold metallo-hydrolase [Actinomycetia bacterium]|nr:MBL fold metallo-hydrolase [Actinomycetes bacterium]